MLRLLLWNVSMSYFASYFSTFFFNHDIWRERNKPIPAGNMKWPDRSALNAADEEERLLCEEQEQNSQIVSGICFIIFLCSLQILN